jgi:hypothetical protein
MDDERTRNAIRRLREGVIQLAAILDMRDDWTTTEAETINLALGDIAQAIDFLMEES